MRSMKKQKGMVTIFVSVMLLLLITLNVFIGAKSSVIEQKSANNVYRTEEANQNAEGGVSQLIANLKAYITANPTAKVLTATTITNDPNASKFTATFNPANNTITSTGKGSGNAIRTVTQRIKLTAGAGGSLAALNTLGTVNLGGSATATSITTGATVTGNKTYTGVDGTKGIATQITENFSGFDVGSRRMNTHEYFMYFFGDMCPTAKNSVPQRPENCKNEVMEAAKKSYENDTIMPPSTMKAYYCASDCATKSNDDAMTTAYNNGKRIFWLDGGGINHKVDMGTPTDPVLIFVMKLKNDQVAKVNANSTIYGVLYVDAIDGESNTTIQVEGTWNGSGTGHSVIQGATITSGNYTGQGNVQFVQDSTIIKNLGAIGLAGGSGFSSAPASLTIDPHGWTDAN